MHSIYSAETLVQVEHARSVLSEAGIETAVRNRYLSGAVGELPAFECWPELLLLDPSQAGRARALLEQLHAPPARAQAPWRCAGCGEYLEGQFGQCWNCGQTAPDPDDDLPRG